MLRTYLNKRTGRTVAYFSEKYAGNVSRQAQFNFQQRDMPYFRRQMVNEILTKKLLKPLTIPTEIQPKASAPNTIQHLPARPQTTGPNPRNMDMPPGKFTTPFHPIHSKTVNVNNYISGVKIPDENLTPQQQQHGIIPGGPRPMKIVGRPSPMMPQQQQQPPPPQQTTTAAEAVAAAHAAGPGPLHVSSGMGGMSMNMGGSNEPGMGQQPGMGGPMGNMDIGGMSPGGPMKGTNDESNGPGNMINNPNKMGRPMAGEVLCVPSPLPMSEDFIQDLLRNVEEDAKKHSLHKKRIEEEQNTKKEIFKMKILLKQKIK